MTDKQLKQIEDIAEELRVTRYKKDGHIAFDYIYNKYKHVFKSYRQFLKLMKIEAVFFSCKENVQEIRKNTKYIYVDD